MTPEQQAASKELYRRLRNSSCAHLWEEEVPRFNRAIAPDRLQAVAVIRAVGVVFSEMGTAAQKREARRWLRELLHDPSEKIRRYAMTALPKLGADPTDEGEVLALLSETTADRERKYLARTLEKIGGTATLEALQRQGGGGLSQTELKVRASVARRQEPSAIRMGRVFSAPGMRVHLRCRDGLEEIVREEVEAQGNFRVAKVSRGVVTVTCPEPFTLGDVYAMRCFATAGFELGEVRYAPDEMDALATVMTSPLARQFLETFTEGSVRYRLEFVGRGHQRGAVRLLANKAYARCPEMLNDPKEAPWSMWIHPTAVGSVVELAPRLRPDPRFAYRRDDVPAASHPPLAASLARVSGSLQDAVVWDPFCGSGLELIERSLLGGVQKVYGTDLSPKAVAVAEANFAAANVPAVQASFLCSDFRDFPRIQGLASGGADLIITNPPMGKRVPVADLVGLIAGLFAAAAAVLRPGGRLVFTNPLPLENAERSLAFVSRTAVDLGGLECRLEVYRKVGR